MMPVSQTVRTSFRHLSLLFASLIPAAAAAYADRDAFITVTSPNGGEVWEAGTTQFVTWDYTDPYGSVQISLLRGGELYDYIGSAWMNAGELEWTVCNVVGDSSDYAVRIVSVHCEPPVEDTSDAPFEITGSLPVPTFTLTSPNGGEVWPAGTMQAVTWSTTAPHGYIAAWLLNGAERDTFIGYVPMVAEAITWDICPYAVAGTDYTVQLTWFDACGPDLEDGSDAPFAITALRPMPTLTLTSPNGGEVWPADSTQTITWDSTDPSGDVDLWLTDDNMRYDSLGSAPMADGQFDWPILPCVGDGTAYRIVVRWSACGQSAEDRSDDPFELTGSVDEPVLTVTSPAPGAVWTAGSSQTIEWTSSVANGGLEIELYDGSSFYAHLGRAPVSAGGLTWDICRGIGDGSGYRIRLLLPDCAAETLSDPFQITGSAPPTLTLTSPVGGESWVAGSPYEITWESGNLSGYLDIYVPNDGWHHSGHAVVPVTDGRFTWPIAPTLEPGDYDGVWIWSYDCGQALWQMGGTFAVTASTTAAPDVDGDGDVDLRDLASFQSCATGRGPAPLDPVCDSFDFEPDGDVDRDDFAEAALSMTGP
jgi:hypothetical protein